MASPDSAGAGTDVCISAIARKAARYSSVLDELHREGYDYKPLIWTCWGRPSLDAQAAIRTLAFVAARRRGLADPRPLEMRARALIGAYIWRRAALMVLACLQKATTAEAAALLPAADDWDDWASSVGSDPDGEVVGLPGAAADALAGTGAAGAGGAAAAEAA